MTRSKLAALVTAGAALVSACAGSDAAPDTDAATAAPSADELAVLEIPGLAMFDDEQPVDSTIVVDEPDLETEFALLIDELGTSYSFEAELTAPGGEVINVEGRRVDDSLDYSVLAVDRSVRTVVIGNDLWVTTDGETRTADSRSANGDPLDTLSAPSAVAAHSEIEGAFVVTFPGSVVGRTDIDTVDVIVAVAGQQLQFVYSDEVVSMITTLDPVADPEPIVAPA